MNAESLREYCLTKPGAEETFPFGPETREEFSCVLPGYHMNKKHWNTIVVDGSVSIKQLKVWIDHSYELVANSLSKNKK